MASPVLSVEKHTLTISGGGSFSASASFTGTPDRTNCVPFVTTRVVTQGTNQDSFSAYAVRADFPTSTSVRVQTANSTELGSREIVCEVTVVEFDPTYVNVYQGVASKTAASVTVTDAFGAGPVTVDQSKAWLYFTYTTDSGTEWWRSHQHRGVIGDGDGTGTASTVTFDVDTGGATVNVDWYVVECKNTEWSVQVRDLSLVDASGSVSATDLGGVTTAKTFVLGSYVGSDAGDADDNSENTINVTLTSGTTVTATRQSAVAGNGQIDWHGYIVTFSASGNENVYRDTLTQTSATSPDTDTIGTAVTIADSWVHPAGSTGVLGCGSFPDTNNGSGGVMDSFVAWTITGTTQVTCTHSTTGGEANNILSWEVIEWDVGGAAPARRVMVVS